MLHLVPAQVHVNGHRNAHPDAAAATATGGRHSAMDRETDILDDELPGGQGANSVDSLGTFSSTEGRATPADLYDQAELTPSDGQDHVAYLERSAPERPLEAPGGWYGEAGGSAQSGSMSTWDQYPAGLNGGLLRSQSCGGSMPRAPTRTTSSKNAVQRGLNVWQRFGVPEEPVTEGLSFSPPRAAHHQPPRRSTSQQEIEQSIETLNILMLDLEPGRPLVPKSQSAPLREPGVVTTQPSFSQSQARPSYQADAAIHSQDAGPRPPTASGPAHGGPSERYGFQGYSGLPNGTGVQAQISGGAGGHLQLKPINSYPASTAAPEGPEQERSPSSVSSQPREADSDDVFSVEGLVAQRVAEYAARTQTVPKNAPQSERQRPQFPSGVQSRGISFEDPAALSPRPRAPGDGVPFHNGPAGDLPDGPLRSPIRCVSPEFVNAIALNPGGRPKERHMHSYREAFEELEAGGPVSPAPLAGGEVFPQTPAFPVSQQTPYFNLCRSPPGLAKTPLSALGLKPHNPAEILLNQTGSAPRSYVESVARSASTSDRDSPGPPESLAPPGDAQPGGQQTTNPRPTQALNTPLSSSSPIQTPSDHQLMDSSSSTAFEPAANSAYHSQPIESLRPAPTSSYQATPSSPYQAMPTSYQPTPNPSYQVPPTSPYQATPTSSTYQTTPTPSSYQATPNSSIYQTTPTPSSYQATPNSSIYQTTPTPSSYQASPNSSAYQTTPTPSSYQATPSPSSFQATPPSSTYQATPTFPSYLDSSSPPSSSYLGFSGPALSYLGHPSSHLGGGGYGASDHSAPAQEPLQALIQGGHAAGPHHTLYSPGPAHSPAHQQQAPLSSLSPSQGGPHLGWHQPAPSGGFEAPGPQDHRGGSPVSARRFSQGGQCSPVPTRQPSLGRPQGSPLTGRRPSTGHQGSPVLARHAAAAASQVSQRSPSLDRHPLQSGYTTPDERHGNLSRQSSSSGYQGPPTPSFPVSPAGYLDGGAPPGPFRQGSPGPGAQPLLPQKRRMSSGERPAHGALSYGTLNGKTSSASSSALSGGGTPGYFHTLPDFSKFNMPDGSPETRLNVKFVQDTSKFWYKPEISREQAIGLLKERDPGAFVIRDSHSFRGAYGLAMKVASPPPTVQPTKKAGDSTNELVRHFLIESSPKGVKLKGCPNEPFFGCLSALVYQHAITPLALPCSLLIPTTDLSEEVTVVPVATNPVADRLKQGAVPSVQRAPDDSHACNVLYINSVDMESLTGPQAVAKAISETLAAGTPPAGTVVHFKVSAQGITLTDNQRKLFFRRHYPCSSITFCDIDPQDRKWNKSEGGLAKLFGFVARKQGSTTDNVSHLFAEMEPEQPANAIVSFVLKMIAAQKR